MADKKISALTAATTPLAGTEVLPIVQSSTTKQVSVANLTAGRDISTTGITVSSNTGNIELNWATGSTHKVGSTFSTSFFTGMRVDADTRNTDIVSFDASGIGNVRIRTGTTETTRLNVDPTGNVTVSTGNLVIGTSGKGVTDSTAAVSLNFSSTAITANAPVVAALFRTDSGTVSALNATATTIYTMPTLPNGLYVVQAALANNAPATFTAVSLIRQGNGTSAATALALATNMVITVSGLNIQATQTAGGTATVTWTVFRIA